MPIPADLLAILACPVCRQPLHELPDQSGLKCDSCKRVYPIVDDIPSLLPEQGIISSE